MRECPQCGFKEPPIWRNKLHRLYTQYCRLDELEDWDQELANLLKQNNYVFKDGVKYQNNGKGYINKIEAYLCQDPNPNHSSISEPNTEKRKAAVIGYDKKQKKL